MGYLRTFSHMCRMYLGYIHLHCPVLFSPNFHCPQVPFLFPASYSSAFVCVRACVCIMSVRMCVCMCVSVRVCARV